MEMMPGQPFKAGGLRPGLHLAETPLPRMALLLLLCLLSLFCSRGSSSWAPLALDGDYALAGLFPIHRGNANPSQRPRPQVEVCESATVRSSHSYYLVQAMRFAMEEINNASDLLPNVTLGYAIYDTCGSSANMYATLSILSQGGDGCRGHRDVAVAANYTFYRPSAVAAIGPDSSEEALLTASLLGIFQVPEVSYEATSRTLSQKRIFPSFLRTVPSDRLQVDVLVRLLSAFHWTWVAVLGSDNNYGRQGLQMLREATPQAGICFAYQGILPVNKDATREVLARIILDVVASSAKVVILFSNKHSVRSFFQEAIQQNVTGKIWVGTEDWSLSTDIWEIPGIWSIGTVIGVSVKQAQLPGLKEFEADFAESARAKAEHSSLSDAKATSCQNCRETCSQPCSHFCRPDSVTEWEPSPYDMQGAFSVYSAVYAVGHGLHRLLGCHTGLCHKGTVYPWQLLREVKRVNFSLYQRQVYFDANGDTLGGYDLVLWMWEGQDWNYRVIGSFNPPDHLSIDREKIQWQTEDNQVPVSVCSKDCDVGEQKVLQGMHRCCFHCVACLPGTFLNKSDLYTCQTCRKGQWSPAKSEACFERTVIFLPWADPISLTLLAITTLLLSLMASTAFFFSRNLETPVVRSAGGRLSFAMLGALAGATLSLYCNFGVPGRLNCPLRFPLYNISFSLCLACMVARSVQIVIIFKMATKAPSLYEAWQRYHGPHLLIVVLTSLQGLLALISLSIDLPAPLQDYNISPKLIFLVCSTMDSILTLSGIIYNGLLGVACFVVSYLGKDLPSSYSEAKCITFSLLVYFVSFVCYSIVRQIYQGRYLIAFYVTSHLCTLAGVFGGYFAPKAYIILFHSERNTNEHFQMSIQSYTKRTNLAG
ncbi:taste receptor type 1 member 1 [Sceloporus undulatus]|uniref:taste receptor type 1 member 1 n=1 Tax=Sceloporus undulatus TaxID=8520 RepID=UPI001C4DA00C|nr:taste receptor type 1 member 1 [Sceloporus undulatus]